MTVYNPGMLVQARRRLWRVDGQQDSILFLTAVDETSNQTRLYLPLETVQPGQLPPPSADTIGSPQVVDLMTRAFRLSMLNSTAPLLSLQRSRAIPVEYQLVPVVMALGQQRVRLLIADDVGLGKTIEAGLVLTELLARGRARRVLVICPANLRQQWQHALDYFFHIEAKILSRTERRALERGLPVGSNLLEFYPTFIVSVDYAKSPEIKNQILEVPWDVVLIDEAHQVAKPHQMTADQRVKMERWELGKAVAFSPRVQHLLLLTATPHNGYTDTFASLLHLLNVGAVEGPPHDPIIHREIARKHVVQRRREDVEEWLLKANQRDGSFSAFPRRDQGEEFINIGVEERQVIEAVNHYGKMVLEHASTAQAQIRTLAGWTVLHLHKRALSSPEALRRSLKNRRKALEDRLNNLVEEEAGLTEEAARAYVTDEDPGEQYDEDEPGARSEKVVPGDQQALQAELKALDDLEALAARITPARDSKLQHLMRNLLRPRLTQHRKLILFTRYRDTMEYVAGQIQKSPMFSNTHVETLHGGLNEKQRQEALARFEAAETSVLVATDAISEGVNLQYLASQMIHYELPWNPNRLEQRTGRIDRFGQPARVVWVRTLVMNETLDAVILRALMEKARRIRKDYGYSPPFFGDDLNIIDFIHQHGLGIRLGAQQLSLFNPQPEAVDLPEAYSKELLDRIQSESFYGQTDLQLADIEEQVRQVHESLGSPEEIRRFVENALGLFGCPVSANADGTFLVQLTHPHLRLPGLGEVIRHATFDPKLGQDRQDVDVLDLGHPLVRALLDLIKREAFQAENETGEPTRLDYGRTAAFLTRDVEEMTAQYTLLVRYTTQTTPPQILEDLQVVSIPVYDDTPLPANESQRLLHAKPAPGALTDGEVREVVQEALERPELDALLTEQIENRRQELVDSRKRMRETLGRHAAWLAGADELTLASWDLLAVKVLWPA